ncbi:hypothetical protein SCB49_01782 [unidentified eubacterium SCB49]|nr:hypothetical protein SCB49_01782 [unidentified eubacterium SCB49]
MIKFYLVFVANECLLWLNTKSCGVDKNEGTLP